MKISILLPYKENFSPSYPGAISIFLKALRNIEIAPGYDGEKFSLYGNSIEIFIFY